MPSKYNKVHKHVNKKKGGTGTNSLHENSRDAIRLRNAVVRDDRVSRMSKVRERTNEPFMLRVDFFQDLIPESGEALSDSDIHKGIQQYLAREDETLAALKAERRPGRPASSKQTLLEQQQASEQKEYEHGFWMPDMRNEVTLKKMKEWKGEWVGLSQLTFVRVEKSGEVKESAFPPKGAA